MNSYMEVGPPYTGLQLGFACPSCVSWLSVGCRPNPWFLECMERGRGRQGISRAAEAKRMGGTGQLLAAGCNERNMGIVSRPARHIGLLKPPGGRAVLYCASRAFTLVGYMRITVGGLGRTGWMPLRLCIMMSCWDRLPGP